MQHRCQLRLLALAIGSLLAGSANAADTSGKAKVPLAADGRPNLEGIWLSGTLTPLERPASLAEKPFFSRAEMQQRQEESSKAYWAAGHRPEDVGRDNDAFIDSDLAILPSGQTSLVVAPADGRIPLRPEADAQRSLSLENYESFETMSQWDRCITREPTTMFPVIYNNAYQIVQTPTHLVISAEMVHDARVIPLDGRPRLDPRVKGWAGDSRAHWEGNTLVVETTNFNDRGWIATGLNAGRLRGVPYDSDLRTIERFTRIDSATMNYEITIDNPKFYTSPWTISYPLKRDDSYRMYEYACHEGNRAVELILGGVRAQERVRQ